MFEFIVTIVYIIILIIAFLGAVAALAVMIGTIFNPPDDIYTGIPFRWFRRGDD